MPQILQAQPYTSVEIWEVPRLKSWKQIAGAIIVSEMKMVRKEIKIRAEWKERGRRNIQWDVFVIGYTEA